MNKPTKEEMEAIRALTLAEPELSPTELGKRLGWSHVSMRKYLRELGLYVRRGSLGSFPGPTGRGVVPLDGLSAVVKCKQVFPGKAVHIRWLGKAPPVAILTVQFGQFRVNLDAPALRTHPFEWEIDP